MYPKYNVRFCLHEQLDLALRVQVRLCVRVYKERKAADFILYPGLHEFLLRFADSRDLRVRVRVYYARDRVVIHVAVPAMDVLRGSDAPMCASIGPQVASPMHLMFGAPVLDRKSVV